MTPLPSTLKSMRPISNDLSERTVCEDYESVGLGDGF